MGNITKKRKMKTEDSCYKFLHIKIPLENDKKLGLQKRSQATKLNLNFAFNGTQEYFVAGTKLVIHY